MLSGILGAITGAIGMIQGLLSKIGDFLDLFCDGAVSCAIGISTFETCQGAQAKGNDKKKKQEDQYPVKPPKMVKLLVMANQTLKDMSILSGWTAVGIQHQNW